MTDENDQNDPLAAIAELSLTPNDAAVVLRLMEQAWDKGYTADTFAGNPYCRESDDMTDADYGKSGVGKRQVTFRDQAALDEYVQEALDERWVVGWQDAMDWLAEYKGAAGIALAEEMATRLPVAPPLGGSDD